MEKLPMCRVCLAENVRMHIVVNRNLHELYEKLTDIPFVTEDSRPILACFICCTKLKQCYRLLRQCQEAEKLFAQKINDNYEPKPLINQDHLEFYSGFIKTPTENISIVDEGQTEGIAIKEELPAVCEGVDDVIEPKEEHKSDDEWNTPGTSSQHTVAPPLPPPTPQPPALPPPPAPVQTQWQPPKKKKKTDDAVLKIFKECEGNAREYEKEHDRIVKELERERIRQRDVELQLQAQWSDFMKEALELLKSYLGKRSE